MPTVYVRGHARQITKGMTFEEILEPEIKTQKGGDEIALVYFNGKMRELFKRCDRDGVIAPITTRDSAGHSAYCRTAIMMMVKSADEIAKEKGLNVRVKVEFTLGSAFYCTLHGDPFAVTKDFTNELVRRMRKLSDDRTVLVKKTYPIDDAIALFHHQGMTDKEKLFRYRTSSTVNVYNLDGYYDYFYGYMLPDCGYCTLFDVFPYKEGLCLNLPTQEEPDKLQPFVEQENLYDQLALSTRWGELVDISTVGDLNEQICKGNISDMILVQEALQERRIGEIAEQIHERSGVKFVLIAGPSSSGKTTFAHRLSVQLRSLGMHPHILSMDNWFVNRDKTPIDIDGNYNYDVIEALDLEQFNEDLTNLLKGQEVPLPTFDFRMGRRKYTGESLKLEASDILVIEGIHGLNPRCTEAIPDENKFRIYISALTSLNVDEHNRIPTSDTRLLRRIVRDNRTRGKSARATIAEWKKVRDAEEVNIFPYQDNVDAVFNSVLIYEQAVLKQFAEPLLFGIDKSQKEYYEAKRLLKFLEYFVGVDTASVPANSICREFVGGGCFPV